jgi:hypothetical protein
VSIHCFAFNAYRELISSKYEDLLKAIILDLRLGSEPFGIVFAALVSTVSRFVDVPTSLFYRSVWLVIITLLGPNRVILVLVKANVALNVSTH